MPPLLPVVRMVAHMRGGQMMEDMIAIELALEIWYEWHGVRKRNLVSLCHDCHEAVHGYRKPEKKETLTEERWD